MFLKDRGEGRKVRWKRELKEGEQMRGGRNYIQRTGEKEGKEGGKGEGSKESR